VCQTRCEGVRIQKKDNCWMPVDLFSENMYNKGKRGVIWKQ